MKLSRLAGLAALAVLAIGQARAENGPADNGLGFGIIRDLSQATKSVEQVLRPIQHGNPDGFLTVTDIRLVRSDPLRME